MYEISKGKFGKLFIYTLVNAATGEKASIIPEYGANVNSLILSRNNRLHEIIYSDKNTKELHANCCYRGAKLIPFPNRINNGKYKFQEKSYQLELNHEEEKHAIHGFVYNQPFTVNNVVTESNFAKIDLEYDYNGDKKGYPFKLKVLVNYILCNEGFRVNTMIINVSGQRIPVGDGWHPYFSMSEKIDDLKLKIPSSTKIEVDSRMIPTGETTVYSGFQDFETINDTSFDTGFVVNQSSDATTSLYSPKTDTTINLWQESENGKYRYLQIYTPPDRKSIAIEPMSCMTDAFNNQNGLVVLEPGDSFSGSYGIYLS